MASKINNMWKEIEVAKSENRRELVLTGADILSKISEKGLDENLFNLTQLNFLEISRVGLPSLSENIGCLANLTNLVLCHNKIVELPTSVCKLTKLKLLDISNNSLSQIPEELGELKYLQSLNASCNKLSTFPNVCKLVNLHHLDISHNNLTELPDGIDSSELGSLLTLTANDNQIETVSESLCDLPLLKALDLSNNALVALPPQLSECGKLKDFKCTGNKLKDKRLLKLVTQCSTKAILDYLKTQKPAESNAKKDDKSKKSKNKSKKDKNHEEIVVKNAIKVLHFDNEGSLLVKAMPQALTIRPFIVCCIVRNLDFSKSPSLMRRFIALQTRLHDEICVKRQLATIATHDLDKIKFPLVYDAREPQSIKIQPLNKLKELTADVLVARLRREAEELRKEKKRNAISGIHKYLNLLKDHTHYTCIVDNTSCVISFPPIVNSNASKVTKSTHNILIEVTGSQNLEVCKKVMDEMLTNLLKMGLGQETPIVSRSNEVESVTDTAQALSITATADSGDTEPEDGADKKAKTTESKQDEGCNNEGDDGKEEDDINDHPLPDDGTAKILIVEQVKIVDHLNNLKVVYPSRVDLQSNDMFKVIRDFE